MAMKHKGFGTQWVLLGPILGLALSLMSSGCSQSASESLPVVASIRPLALLVAELTDGLPVEITTLLPEGATPHEFTLKPSDLRALETAKLVLWVGASGEPYLTRIADRPSHVAFDAQPGVRQLPWFGPKPEAHAAGATDDAEHEPMAHDHSDYDNRVHGETDHSQYGRFDPHLWLSERNVRALLPVLTARLIALQPEWEAPLTANAAAMAERLQQGLALSQQRVAAAASLSETVVSRRQPGPGIAVLHDAYRYLATDLDVAVLTVVVPAHGVTPGIRHLTRLQSRFSVEPPHCLVIDPNESGRLLAKLLPPQGLSQVTLDPMAWQGVGTGQPFSQWLSANYEALANCVVAGLEGTPAAASADTHSP